MGCCLGCGWVFGGGAVWGALRATVQAHFCEIDGRVQGACSLGCCCRCCFAVGGASDVAGARLTAGCCLGRSSGGAVGGADVQSLLSGVYAGVFFEYKRKKTKWLDWKLQLKTRKLNA